ncbi:hypothetical protein [Albirhodobacter sp. R86504]|uniref:hypothetical protein n=1 Tax=Albirhodobacter sp. R86504 TaxID=3093848 RepID=UPI00366C3F11
MSKPLFFALAFVTTLSGCGFSESRINPMNWWGGGAPDVTTLEPEEGYAEAPNDNRIEIAQLTQLDLKKVHGGVMVVAKGLPPTQGWWDAELMPVGDGEPVEGELTFRFVVSEPLPDTPERTRVLNAGSREITVATFVSIYKLDGVRTITVAAANGTRSVRP